MSEAIQNARRWLAAYEGMPIAVQQRTESGAVHVRALLQEMALMGRRPAEAGYEWLMTNVDAQVSHAIEAGNEHRHHEEDIHLRVAMVRSNQAVAAALWDGATTARKSSDWDTLTAKEADAFQSVVMAVLGVSPGGIRELPGYPDMTVQQIIATTSWTEGLTANEVEEVCAALVEAGPWDDIDGDGTNGSLIVEHIQRLGKLALSTGEVSALQKQQLEARIEEARKLILTILARLPSTSDAYRVLDQAQSYLADPWRDEPATPTA